MDCHRCIHIRYDGSPYGRCGHPCHSGVRFVLKSLRKGRGRSKRPYSKEKCPDFEIQKRCSNCRYWSRGRYFADGKTPAAKGRCSLELPEKGGECPIWKVGYAKRKKSS